MAKCSPVPPSRWPAGSRNTALCHHSAKMPDFVCRLKFATVLQLLPLAGRTPPPFGSGYSAGCRISTAHPAKSAGRPTAFRCGILHEVLAFHYPTAGKHTKLHPKDRTWKKQDNVRPATSRKGPEMRLDFYRAVLLRQFRPPSVGRLPPCRP